MFLVKLGLLELIAFFCDSFSVLLLITSQNFFVICFFLSGLLLLQKLSYF